MNATHKPLYVRRAQLERDIGVLQRAGRAGGRAAAKSRRETKAEEKAAREYWDAYVALRAERDEKRRRTQANEHILPIDPEANASEW